MPHVLPLPETTRIRLFVVFFGANDACVPEAESGQHVPLAEYVANLEQIIKHPSVVAHNPKVLLVAPAPIDEHSVWANDRGQGRVHMSRKNAVVKQYADAAVGLGEKLGVPTVNLWKAFMAQTGWEEANWSHQEPLVGSLQVPQHQELTRLMYDGRFCNH